MKIFLIAQIIESNKVWGCRLLDVDESKVSDYPISSVKSVLNNPATASIIQNVKLVNGELTGTNGQLSRYPKITRTGMLISLHGESPLIVINKIDDIGYTVADFNGKIKKMKNSDVVEYAKNFGIANGKVVIQDNVEYVSSISDSYEQISMSPSKTGARSKVNISIHMGEDSGAIARHTENEINTELQYSDVFSAMSPEQRAVLKHYYTWYTVDTYKKLAKNVRLNLAPGKAEKLAQLRGIDKWKFAGVNDSYLEGRFNAKCELGHSLRYEYFAIPEDETEDLSARTRDWHNYAFRTTRGAQDELRDRGAIVFGETCAGDFFNIAPEDMKKLVKVRKQMSEEIELLADIITNKMESLYMKKAEFLYTVLREMGSGESIVNAFGDKVGYTLMAFIKVKLPFPKSLVILAGEQARNNIDSFYTEGFSIGKNLINSITSDVESNNIAYKNAKQLLKYVVDFTIEGEYQYDPINDKDNTRRDIGAYNKQTRYERAYLLKQIKSGTMVGEDKSYCNIKKWIDLVASAINRCTVLEKYIDNSKLIQAKFVDGVSPARFTNLINNFTEDPDKVENTEDIDYLNYVNSVLSFSRKYSNMNYFTNKTQVYSTRYRSRGYHKSLESLVELYTKMSYISDDEIISRSIKLYENSIEEEIKKKEEEMLMTPEYFKVTLNEDSEHFNQYNGYSVLIECTGQSKYSIRQLYEGTLEQECKFNAYSGPFKTDTEISSKEITADELNQLGYFEYKRLKEEFDSKYRFAKLEEQREKERAEEELRRKQLEEEKRKKEEQERIEAEQQAKAFEADEKMQKLKKLLEDNNDKVVDYGIDVAKNILNKGIPYNKLSPKQQWRVDDTISKLGGASEDNSIKNDKQKLSENPEVENNINKLLEINKGNDKDAIQKVNLASRIAFDIARTIKYKGEYSEKQLKHINKAIEALK